MECSCSLWCKDTNFSANHNLPKKRLCERWVVLYDAKILIFQQITTYPHQNTKRASCSLWCKDTNFSANHNKTLEQQWKGLVVLYDAKILIFQQITTFPKFKGFSKCCSLWCKDTNFSANHNNGSRAARGLIVVLYDAKILIFQQITTTAICGL